MAVYPTLINGVVLHFSIVLQFLHLEKWSGFPFFCGSPISRGGKNSNILIFTVLFVSFTCNLLRNCAVAFIQDVSTPSHLHCYYTAPQFILVAQLYPTPCDHMDCNTPASLCITNSQSVLKLMSIKSVMPFNHLILCDPLLLPSIFCSIKALSMSQFFTSNYWSFSIRLSFRIRLSFSISLSNEYSGLISFMIDWFDLHALQGTRQSLLQQHTSEASILQRSTFFMVQISHPYMTTGKTIALTM